MVSICNDMLELAPSLSGIGGVWTTLWRSCSISCFILREIGSRLTLVCSWSIVVIIIVVTDLIFRAIAIVTKTAVIVFLGNLNEYLIGDVYNIMNGTFDKR